jgi:hypothetical protein
MLCNPVIGCFGVSIDGVDFLSRMFPAIISLLFIIGIVLFMFKFLFGGIKYIISGGNKEKLIEARKTLTDASIGLAILLSFFALLSFIECFFGLGLRTINIGLYSISFGAAPICK